MSDKWLNELNKKVDNKQTKSDLHGKDSQNDDMVADFPLYSDSAIGAWITISQG